MALPGKRPLQHIPVEEIGAFAALVLELTGEQVAESFSRVTGKPFRYNELPLAQLRSMSEDAALMFEWLDKKGYGANIAALRRDYPEVGWRSFEDWARAQDWKKLLA
jgi:uncharacterized protein YbjT (DUF2867 family)